MNFLLALPVRFQPSKVSLLKPDVMSGGGSLQQRTTYLISLTLVKVEAVEENGGEAKHSTRAGEERVEAGDSAPSHTGNVAVGKPQTAEDGAVVKKVELSDETNDSDRKRLCPVKERPQSTAKVPVPGPEKPPCDFLIPLPVQKTKMLSAPETEQCTSPPLTTTSSTEPIWTLTRTSHPIRPTGQHPASLLKSHSSVANRGRDSREGRERSPTSAQSLDRKDSRMPTRSPGPCRASWAEASRSEGWRDHKEVRVGTALDHGDGMAAVMRDVPRKERLKTSSASLPAPVSHASKPARKGKSRTLDNSDLNSLSEDLGLAREAQQGQQGQRGSAKDRKMLKFISGIFTKSTSGATGSTAPPVYIQRDSSEEEGRS